MKYLIIGLFVLGSFSSFANTACMDQVESELMYAAKRISDTTGATTSATVWSSRNRNYWLFSSVCP
jgi:hypothetical protein